MSHPVEGKRWAHFHIRSEVARGNMGVVYQVEDTRDGREVALKILVVGHRDPDAGERFKREAKSLARLSHPNIVNVHSYGVHDGVPFLTMDYVPGTNLQELLNRSALPRVRAVDMLARISRAIDHAHSRGVLHRDIKPANVLIGSDGKPRITDFGLAKLSDASVSLTQDGDLIGTPVYMSPEQITGDLRALGPSSDVWALGVVLYVMLTGGLPFRGKTVDVVSQAVVQMDPEPPSSVEPSVPEDLEQICLTALQKDPKLRYRTAGELARDLEAYLSGKPVLAGKVTPAVRLRRALRFAQLHAGALAAGVGCLVMVVGLILVNTYLATSAEARTSHDFVNRASVKRQAALQALVAAERSLQALEPWETLTLVAEARQDIRWASAYLARATQPLEGGTQAFEQEPRDEEVQAGMPRDPALGTLLERARGLRGRALARGGLRKEDPGYETSAADAAKALTAAFRSSGRLDDLEALVALARREGSRELARRATDMLASQTRGEVSDRSLRLRVAAAALTGGRPRDLWTPHLSAAGPLGRAALALEATWLLDRGQLSTAKKLLDKVSLGTRGRWLRARLLRLDGEWEQHSAMLLPLLRKEVPRSSRMRARFELAEALLDQGHNRLVKRRMTKLLRKRLPPAERERGWLLDAAAHCALEGRGGRLRTILQSPSRDPRTRLRATRLLLLAEPASRPPTPAGLTAGDQVRVRLARMALEIERALADVVLRRIGLGAEPRVPSPSLRRKHAELCEAGRELGDPAALAAGAILFLDQQQKTEARALLKRAPPHALSHPAIALANRLLRDDPFRTGAGGLLLEPPAPPGLREGRAALALFQHNLWTGKAEGTERHRTKALACLGLAVRADPFHLAARLARARLNVLCAGRPVNARLARLYRRAALQDAAVACAIDPDAPEAWSLYLQTLWVYDRERVRRTKVVGQWSAPDGPSLARHEVLLAKALVRLSNRRRHLWRGSKLWGKQAAGRALRYLIRAETNGRRRLREPPRDEASVAGRLRAHLKGATPLQAAILQGELILEEPVELDDILRGSTRIELSATDRDRIDAMIDGKHPDAVPARVVRLVLSLLALGTHPSDKARQRTLREGRADLEAVARARPVPGVLALEAALTVWAGRPRLEELIDLVQYEWRGSLYALLRDLLARRRPAGRQEQRLLELPPLMRLMQGG